MRLYVDAAGRPNVVPHEESWTARWQGAYAHAGLWLVIGALLAVRACVGRFGLSWIHAIGAVLAISVALGLVAWSTWSAVSASPDGRNRRLVRRSIADMTLRSIGEHETGRARVSGRVRVLSPAPGEAPDVGAALRRTREATTMSERSTCGRFAVIDETGVAIVDDDSCLVWSRWGRGLPARRPGAYVVRDGDHVEVVGPAHRGQADEARELLPPTHRGYREATTSEALLFDGQPNDRVIVLVDHAESASFV